MTKKIHRGRQDWQISFCGARRRGGDAVINRAPLCLFWVLRAAPARGPLNVVALGDARRDAGVIPVVLEGIGTVRSFP